jgi:hypothetical protein
MSRDRHPDLEWLIETVWGRGTTNGRSTTLRVIPSERRARMLVPEDRAAAAAALRAAGGTRSRRAQRARSLSAGLLRLGWFHDRVAVPSDDPLSAGIAEACGVPGVTLAAAIRRPGPFRKPGLQVLGPDGRVIAYAKVSWNEVTAVNVRAEHAALRALVRATALSAPAPIALIEHMGYPVSLSEPMPAALRRLGDEASSSDPAVIEDLAAILEVTAVTDPIRRRLDARLAAIPSDVLEPVRDGVAELLDSLGSRTASLRAGAWHGDWSPWNLGMVGSRLWAWDWEYCRPDVPVGLDVAHLVFQRRFIGDRAAADAAFRDARAATRSSLGALGYDTEAGDTLHAVHVAEMGLRYLEAAAHGVEPNRRFVASAPAAIRDAFGSLG